MMRKMLKSLACWLMVGITVCSLGACKKPSESGDGTLIGTNEANVGAEPVSFELQKVNGKNVPIVAYGKSDYKIVIPTNATATETLAAEELQYFLFESTTCRLDIITDTGLSHDNSKKYISIGHTSLLKAQEDIRLNQAKMAFKAPIIQTRENTVYLVGDHHDNGTLCAVYKFLHYSINYEAYAVDCVYYDTCDVVLLRDFDYTYVPAVDFTIGHNEIMQKNNLVNTYRMCLSPTRSSEATVNADGSRVFGAYCHSCYAFANPAIYQEEHPEWFEYGGGNLCYTNDELAMVCAENAIKIIDRFNCPTLMLGGVDLPSYCSCTNCTEAYKSYGISGVYMRFLNKVATLYSELRPDLKDVILYGMAYSAYEGAPVERKENGEIVLIDESVKAVENVGMCYTPLQHCLVHPFDGDSACKTNQSYFMTMEGWKAVVGDNLIMMDCGTNFTGFFYHANEWNSLKQNFLTYKELGVKFVTRQGSNANGVSPFQSLRLYVNAKLAWDPYLDTDKLIDDFMLHYYGDGHRVMREFFDNVEEHFAWIAEKQGSTCGSCYAMITGTEYWPRNVLTRFENQLKQAQNLAENTKGASAELREQLATNVYKEYVMMNALNYILYPTYYSTNERAAVKAELLAAFDKFNIVCVSELVNVVLD